MMLHKVSNRCKNLNFILAFFMALSSVMSSAVDIDARNKEIHRWDKARQSLFQKLSRRHGPVFLQDATMEQFDWKNPDGTVTKVWKILRPGDAILSPFYLDPKHGTNFMLSQADWAKNPDAICETRPDSMGNQVCPYTLVARMPVSMIETETNFYLSYMRYNARDTGDGDHGQDTEVVFIVINKNADGSPGAVDFFMLNSHRWGEIYAEDPQRQHELRERLRSMTGDDLHWWIVGDYGSQVVAEVILVKESSSGVHHAESASDPNSQPVFLRDEKNQVISMMVLSHRDSHMLTKLNLEVLKKGIGQGYAYVCVDPGKEGCTSLCPVPEEKDRFVGYSTFSLDKMILGLYPDNWDQLALSEQVKLTNIRNRYFEADRTQKDDMGSTVFNVDENDKSGHEIGHIRFRPELPTYLVPGTGSKKSANLPNQWDARTSLYLAAPHLLHQALEPGQKISSKYLFNPYIEYVK